MSVLDAFSREPYRFDFYAMMRLLECEYRDKPRWGQALRPNDEPVRLGQDPDLGFAPSALAKLEPGREGRPPHLQVRLFGLLGPNGPLPLHITELARSRMRHSADPTLSRFLDLFNHRLLALFYRAWSQAQPHVNFDRPEDDRFAVFVGAFIGLGTPTLRNRDTVPDFAKFFHAGALARHVRNGEGLASLLGHFFSVPVKIEEFVGHWMPLDVNQRTRLGREEAVLGRGAVAGGRVWDFQSKFRIHLGPLTLEQYEAFLPPTRQESSHGGGGRPNQLQALVDWVRLYVCFELDWDIRICLKASEVPALRLGGRGRLGLTTWLGTRKTRADAADLCLDAEACIERIRVAA